MISVLSKRIGQQKAFLQVKSADKNYVIGFNRLEVATRIYKRMHPSTIQHIYLMRSRAENITKEVNLELENIGLESFSVNDLVVDVDARLVIPKEKINKRRNVDDYELSAMTKMEFMMLPFERFLGIALADDIERESQSLVILNCQLIDPCYSYNMFKTQLGE